MATYPLPPLFAQDGWYTASFVAYRLRVSLRTVEGWARDDRWGTPLLLRMGIRHIISPINGLTGRSILWLYIGEKERKYARFKDVPLDISSPQPLRWPPYEDAGIIRGSGTPPLREGP